MADVDSKHTKVIFTSEARKQLLIGLNTTADAVCCTLGPKGKTVLIQQSDGTPLVTKDGVTVSKSINLKDPLQRLGSKLVQTAAAQTNELAGDGTTTATLLTQALINNCMKFLSADQSPFSMKNGIIAGVDHVIANLNRIKKNISSDVEIQQIATISANGEISIGEIIASAIKKVTKDGIITIEDARGMNTTIDVVEGMQLNRGYLSPYFVNNKEKMIAEHENCRVLVTNEKITDLNDILPILNQTIENKESLLIIADDVDGTAMQGLLVNRTKINLPVVAIKAPGFGEYRMDLLSDLCALSGAELIGSLTGTAIKNVKREQLGTCKKVIVARGFTTLLGAKSTKLDEHVINLKNLLTDVTISYERMMLLRGRIASLVNGVAIIRVGGATEFEMHERRDRVEDALNATKAAIDEGIVPGGGIALLSASKGIESIKPGNDEIDVDSFASGLKIVKYACEAPFKRIVENAGQSFSALKEKIPNDDRFGYDAKLEKFVNMIDDGILDPVKVTRCALQHAMSVALTFLSLDAVIYNEVEDVG